MGCRLKSLSLLGFDFGGKGKRKQVLGIRAKSGTAETGHSSGCWLENFSRGGLYGRPIRGNNGRGRAEHNAVKMRGDLGSKESTSRAKFENLRSWTASTMKKAVKSDWSGRVGERTV